MTSIILTLSDVRKNFGEVKAVNGVSFQLSEGEIIGILGPNGAGKTTLINLISGELLPDAGRIVYRGRNITFSPIYERRRLGIARSYQLPQIFGNMTVLENVFVGLLTRKGCIRDFWSLKDSKRELMKKAEEILDALGLANKAFIEAKKLSEGERKVLDIAIALTLNPKLLLLDEPTTSVSSEEKYMVMDVIMKYVKQFNITSVVVEHDLEVVEKYLQSRVLVMNDGKVIYDGNFHGIKLNETVRAIVFGK
jgi:branched-chain amino acid transport system ATP-binding protein